jgi:hypothetical protein
LELAQADLDRDALDGARLSKIRDTVFEFVDHLSDQADREPVGKQATSDAEAAAAVEVVAADPGHGDLPILPKAALCPEWQGEQPILYLAGRTALDEAAAIMAAQLCTVHGLAARVESAEALATKNILRLDTRGVALVCLSYLDASNPAHIRYAVRRVRRKLPTAIVMLGCWMLEHDEERLEALRESTKADQVCPSFGDATRLCVMAAMQINPPANAIATETLAPVLTTDIA